MTKAKIQPTVALEDFGSDSGNFDPRRLEQDERAPLIKSHRFSYDLPSSEAVEMSTLPWYRRPTVWWLLIPFALSALAHGGVMVPMVNLVLGLICKAHFREQPSEPGFEVDERCRIPEVQKKVAAFKLLISLISGCLAAIVSPKLGAMSDRYGRTPVIGFVISGMVIREIITIFAAKFPETVSVNWVLVGAVFDGLGGSFVSAMAIAHSYAADCTSSSRRNVVFGYFHGCLFIGIAAGPVVAGYIVQQTGQVLTMFYLACGAHVLFVLFLFFIIPESVPKARQLAAREQYLRINHQTPLWRRRFQTFNLLEPLKIIHGPSISPAGRNNLIYLACTDTVVFGVGMGAQTVILLYANYTFGWGVWEQSKFASIVNSSKVGCLLIVLPFLTAWYRRRQYPKLVGRPITPVDPDGWEGTDIFELSVIRFAILADIVGYLGYALASSSTGFILAGTVASLGGISSPTMQAALTKHVPRESIGQLLGAMGLLHSIGRAVGPTVFTAIYAATVSFWPQAYFLVLAAMFCVGFALSCMVRPGDIGRLVPRLD